ncbi:hypothetical protein Pmar_PMAR026621 [Perkinsus marinus ATCC 50983]|uniref:RRM domain-containing protein n=1 Tax=Perkinsus marinus (strain ATCC 50983 / TXsc) TaxID=423536 RepID=C5L469_PERM5|nr:hypothetical protein Pmar_PMAR026621 [Perkinsus marinus ATCC 50983]EER08474.1 hypothetical protein Pmar_PMAR026621 [Perkinsus marinus ATCC 50983]|eukprot:XP_002776658.1 hypothetical protein Pmar_PMAR026621 [Perkinsus marinus ATCC 50983]
MTDASDSSPVYPHGLKVVSGGEVEIASYNEALSAGWLSAVHDTDSLSVPNGSLDSSSLLWHVTTPSGLGVHQSSLRSHAQTWDASRKSRPEPSTFAGDNEPPRMNLLEALQVFNEEDEKRVFTVRKVHKLGFKSQYALKKYFSQFGRVKDVVLLPMRAKPKPGPHGQVRAVRPSSMGFVVMQCPEDVQRILAYGDTHTIKGWPIEVRPFVRPSDKQESKVGTYGEGVHASATGLPKEGRSE